VLFLAQNLQQGRSGDVNTLQRRSSASSTGAALGPQLGREQCAGVGRASVTISRRASRRRFSITEMLDDIRDIVWPIAEEKGLALHSSRRAWICGWAIRWKLNRRS